MRKGTPSALRGRSLVISKDYKEWKKILEIQQDNLPVVVLFDGRRNRLEAQRHVQRRHLR